MSNPISKAVKWLTDPLPPAETVEPFETAIKAFAANYKQHDGVYPGGAVQARDYALTDQSGYETVLQAASKFRGSDLFWLQPLMVKADGHAYCSFVLAYFPEKDSTDV